MTTATVPAAPPSQLSKKLIELQIPTIQKMVSPRLIIESSKATPTVLVLIRTRDTAIAIAVWTIKRGSAGRPRRSSINPMAPITNAGIKT